MNLSIRELNELIYCIDIARKYGQLLGTTVADTLAVKLRDELDRRLAIDDDGNYLTIPSEDEIRSHYVSNEEADEDYRSTLVQDEKRYEKSKVNKGITQSILDVVEILGEMSHTDMHNFYRNTFGSNSFSHILKSLIIPYKNRPTRRYLHKAANGKYVVKMAGLHNWVEKDY
jgi:hypothetical protein